jgi:hypothetical protein
MTLLVVLLPLTPSSTLIDRYTLLLRLRREIPPRFSLSLILLLGDHRS